MIPDDIKEKAISACRDIGIGNLVALPEDVAQAILAERQRCAAVAKAYLEDLEGCDLRDDEPDLIAAAILNP